MEKCPKCGAVEGELTDRDSNGDYKFYEYRCKKCGHEWTESSMTTSHALELLREQEEKKPKQ